MKKNQKLNNCKNCTRMQNTKIDLKMCCNWLRGKDKSTNHYKVMHRIEQVPIDEVQKQAQGKWQ